MKSFYGFTQPYNFKRAFPFIVATILLLLIVGTTGAAAIAGKLHWGTYRFEYFLYIGALALAAALLSFAPTCAWLLIALCFIDFSLGVSTHLFEKMGVVKDSILPLDTRSRDAEPRFRYHPLLQATTIPNFSLSVPFRIEHDSYGLRGAERNKEKLRQQIVIATLGGSTTYDVLVADGQTWSDVLERKLGEGYAVLNHGVPGYSTVENLIQTLFYLNSYDIKPQCALYYLGWNDIRNAHLPNLDPAYADFHLMSQLDSLQIRKRPEITEISPLGRIIITYMQAWLEIIPTPEDFSRRDPEGGSDIRLEQIYRSNLEAIAAIDKARGITSIFVGQVLNRAKLQNATRYGWLPLVRDIDVWPLQARFNAILKETADEAGSPELVPSVDAFQDSDFIDNGHFSPMGAEKFAEMLVPLVRANCTKN
jgi:lysophospholipase L1-like esterase